MEGDAGDWRGGWDVGKWCSCGPVGLWWVVKENASIDFNPAPRNEPNLTIRKGHRLDLACRDPTRRCRYPCAIFLTLHAMAPTSMDVETNLVETNLVETFSSRANLHEARRAQAKEEERAKINALLSSRSKHALPNTTALLRQRMAIAAERMDETFSQHRRMREVEAAVINEDVQWRRARIKETARATAVLQAGKAQAEAAQINNLSRERSIARAAKRAAKRTEVAREVNDFLSSPRAMDMLARGAVRSRRPHETLELFASCSLPALVPSR